MNHTTVQVLRKIDQLQLMKQRLTSEKYHAVIDDALTREGLLLLNSSSSGSSSSNATTRLITINIDEASHYILRLSYCLTEELRRWFLQMECELLRHRLSSTTTTTTMSRSHNSMIDLPQSVQSIMNLRPISSELKDELSEPLQQLFYNTISKLAQQQQQQNHKKITYESTKFYSVPFVEALDLLSKRECYLYHGMAYMTEHKLIAILLQKFRTSLSQSLLYMCQHNSMSSSSTPSNHPNTTTTSTHAESLRLEPFLRNINRCLTNPSSSDTHDIDGNAIHGSNTITASTLLQYRNNMPLCMRQLQIGLEQDKKLKHWGRLQYGLFLKGAGMSMEDAIVFFSRHFTSVTNEKFQKEYAYNIRHMYGKEGKRATYTPYNCTKVILGNAPTGGNGEHHGCPYKHYDVDHLDMILKEVHIHNAADRNEILKLKQSHQYQLACVKQFEVQHQKYSSSSSSSNGNVIVDTSMLDNVGNHPNAWFRASIYYQHEFSSNSNTKLSNGSSTTKTISP